MNVHTFRVAIISACMAVALVACSPLPGTPSLAPSTATLQQATASATATPAPTTAAATPVTTQATGSSTLGVCGTYENHLYEVCAAYIWNDAHFSLQPYYKYVHSNSPLSPLRDRLTLKYYGQALQLIQQRAANWPNGTNTVDGPDITILTAQSSLQCNRAVLTTRENWTVRTSNDTVLYPENGQVHTVVLHRIPDERFEFEGHVLHQWVVYELYDGVQNLSVC